MSGHKNAIVWHPDDDAPVKSKMAKFMARVNQQHALCLNDYSALWRWSVDEQAKFWRAIWDFGEVKASQEADQVLQNPDAMPGAKWFVGAKLNYAENLLRYRDEQAAIIFVSEKGTQYQLSYAELFQKAANMAAAFAELGIKSGDRVAAVIPNMPEAIVAMLATSWLGATWSSCSPDFGVQGILDRFEQIEPKLLISVDGYQFKGKQIDIREKIDQVYRALNNCQRIDIAWQGLGVSAQALDWQRLISVQQTPPPFVQLDFDHPLFVMFSSGTTGKPKCIVHGAGGTLLQHLKEHQLHCDIQREDTLFYFTTCGWMMWNWLASGLASGCTLVLFDGNPFYPSEDALWQMADELGVTLFGTSAKYISAQEKAGVDVSKQLPLSQLRSVLSTGSPLAPESYDYLLRAIKPGLQISSISGGTDIVSCFALGNPMLPVRRGELQCRGLGMAVEVFDSQGNTLVNEPGELVCTKPFPCMPTGFWNDADGRRYHAAYFERFPGVWTHGDWTTLTAHDSLIIQGRSDAVLNPGGVRIGTAEIYRQVEQFEEIQESICVGQSWDNDVRVVLFVVLKPGCELDADLCLRIRKKLKENASPRHVPAVIAQVQDVPRTRSGKISELAVRDVVEGRAVKNTEALLNPEALKQYQNRPELYFNSP